MSLRTLHIDWRTHVRASSETSIPLCSSEQWQNTPSWQFVPGADQVVSYGLSAYVVSVLNSTTVLCSCFLRFACHVHTRRAFLNVFFVFWVLSMWSVRVCFSIILWLSQKGLLPSWCVADIFYWFGERLGIYQMRPFFCHPISPALVGALVILDCLVSPHGVSVLFCFATSFSESAGRGEPARNILYCCCSYVCPLFSIFLADSPSATTSTEIPWKSLLPRPQRKSFFWELVQSNGFYPWHLHTGR